MGNVDRGSGKAQSQLSPWRGLLGSMRIRILASVMVLLVASASVSILLLRSTLRERLDEGIVDSLVREVEEFELLLRAEGGGPGALSREDVGNVFDQYFAREVPDDQESLLAFVGNELYDFEIDRDAIPPDDLRDAIAYWLALEEPEVGARTFDAGETRYAALPSGRGPIAGCSSPPTSRPSSRRRSIGPCGPTP
jgi:two-component system, OmpR family, sensor kinase